MSVSKLVSSAIKSPPDKNFAHGDDGSGGQVRRVVTRHCLVPVAGRGLAVDEHGGAAELYGRFVGGRLLKRPALRYVRRRVGGRAALHRRWLAFYVYVAAQ